MPTPCLQKHPELLEDKEELEKIRQNNIEIMKALEKSSRDKKPFWTK